jgi:hypothetical protein
MTGKAIPRLIGTLVACSVVLAACSGAGESTNDTTSPASGGDVTSTNPPASSTGGSGGGGTSISTLDGTWNGSWQSTANNTSGTFSVTWKETGSALDGRLSISVGCLDGAKVTGTVSGSSIDFGSVKGQCEVDYKGSIHGDRMSGTYTISGVSGGTWKASKA